MGLRRLRFATLLLAALSLTMESAHVLELPQKMQYDAALYTAVNSTMYRYFAIVGAVYQVGSILLAGVLAYRLRGRGSVLRWTVAGAALLLLAFAVWLLVVAPVNAQISEATRLHADVPALWMQLRPRWEYGHATGFVLQLAGFSALLWSVLKE